MYLNFFNRGFRGATLLIILITVASVSCKKDFLDQKTLSVITEETVFADSLNSKLYVNSRYKDVNYSYEPNRYGAGGLESACDEADGPFAPVSIFTLISSGAQNPSNGDKTIWTITFQQVRAVNIYLKNQASIPVSTATKKLWEGEVRFLRAWYLATFLKHYGSFPLIGNTVFDENDAIDIPRNTYEECVNYIVTECDAASALLPLNYLSGGVATLEYGRATKGAALGVKARVLLYAASPLTNASRSDDPNKYVSYGNFDANRWKLAANAAQAVINLNEYSLFRASTPAFYQSFLIRQNAEQVFTFLPASSTGGNQFRELLMNSPSRQINANGKQCFPLQELVDLFGMENGLPITDPASGYPGVGDNMYKNRDPRFYYTFSFNGALRALNGYPADQPIYTYTGAVPTGNTSQTSAQLDGIYKNNATKTGYYCYKMLSNTVIGGGSELYRPRMMIRYAEILLNAAEANNEFSGPSPQVYAWIYDIRNRAGILPGANGQYGMKAGMTQAEMRIFIQNERAMELAYEEHRFWDIRRWKIAPVTENKDMHGMEITRVANGSFSYRSIVIRKHVFVDNMYFFPVPQSEITKSPAMKQNPGY